MFGTKIKPNSTITKLNRFSNIFYHCNYTNVDTGLFFNKIREEYKSLTPSESVDVSNVLDKIFKQDSKCSFSSQELDETKKHLVNNIRSKLYSLSDLNELCNITISISNSGILTKSYVSDFLSRLDKLIVSINFENVSSISHCLILLHQKGFKVDGMCTKFYNVLLSDVILEKVDNIGLLKVFECCTSLNVNNKNLDKKLVSEIKTRIIGNKIPRDFIILFIKANNFQKSKLFFINKFLVSEMLKDPSLDLETLIYCLNNCKDLNRDFEKIDRLYLLKRYDLNVKYKLDLINNFGRFKYKPYYLNESLSDICKEIEELSLGESMRLFKNIFELNIYNKLIIENFVNKVNNNQSLEYSNLFCELLLGLCYFSVNDPNVYNTILYEIIRNEIKLNDYNKINLQIFHTLLTSNYMSNNFIDGINPDIRNYLYNNSTKYYETKKSKYMEQITNLMNLLSYSIYEQVNIGGYYLDLIKPNRFRNTNSPEITKENGIAILIKRHYKNSPTIIDNNTNNTSETKQEGSTAVLQMPLDTKFLEEHSKYTMMKNTLINLNVKFLEISKDILRSLSKKHQLEYLNKLISNVS